VNFQNTRQRTSSDEAEILAAIRKEPQRANELSMVLNMGKYEMQKHIRKLLGAGMIERETVTRVRARKPREVRTGRYRAVA